MTQDIPLLLPAALDMSHGAGLKQDLLAATAIDAGQVQRITSPALQLLAAAAMAGARFTAVSEPLCRAAQELGLTTALNFPGDD